MTNPTRYHAAIAILIVAALLPGSIVRAQTKAPPPDSLIEHSLRTLDLASFAWSGDPDRPPPRLGIYITELPADTVKRLAPAPFRDGRGFTIWHVMPHWSADESGVLVGDVLLALNGGAIGDSLFQGEEFLNKRVREMQAGDVVRLTVLRGGTVRELPVRLTAAAVVPMPLAVADPLGPVRSGTWLQETLARLGLTDRSKEIGRQMRMVADQDFNTVPFATKPNFWRLGAVTYLHHYPMRVGALSRTIVGDLWKGVEVGPGVGGAVRAAGRHLDIDAAGQVQLRTAVAGGAAERLPETTAELTSYLSDVQDGLDRAYGPVRGELDSMRVQLLRLLDPDSDWETKLDSIADPVARRAARVAMEGRLAGLFRSATKVDMAALVESSAKLASLADTSWLRAFVAQFRDRTAKEHFPGIDGDVLGWWDTPAGTAIIGGPGPNRYTGTAQFILDLGGDDVYDLSPVPAGTFRYVADMSGNDLYQSRASGQGAGIGAVMVLVDVSGNDTYRAVRFAQGAGLLGVGVCADYGGDDIYASRWCSQGAGFLGIGLLYDAAGADNYLSEVYSQGFGYVKGFGAILDNSGNDSYRAGWKIPDSRYPGRAHLSMSQGFAYGMRPWTLGVGADGGIGVLADRDGNDVYDSDYFSQGGSYWYALGILHDAAGYDRYTAGQYSQGSGIHLSFGALLDDAGDDQYDAYAGLEQGNAHDWSSGCLEDWQGNDTYRGSSSSQGSALTVSFAWLLDSHGNDQYYALASDTTHSQGGGNANRVRGSGSIGLLLDLGKGDDNYVESRVVAGEPVKKGNGIIYDDGKPVAVRP